MARFFIDRPVFAIVLAIIITLLGAIAGFSLPIAQYPNITKPRISVNTNYVGASADIVEKAVAQTIEQKVSGVENMLNMSSVSTSSGEYKLNVEFNLEKNADIASVEVQNRVSQATSSLPSEVSGYGVTTAKESAETIMYFGLYSPKNTYDAMFLRTYADANFLDAVKRVKGVSTVGEYGPEYAVRIWLNPEKMAQLGVTVTDVSNAIKTQNVQAAVGSIGNRPTVDKQERTYSASAQGRLNTPEEFGNVIIRSNNGDNLKLKDIATIKEGPRNDLIVSKLNGGDSVVFPVSLTSDANAIETVKNIREVLKDAESRLPDDMKLVVIQDNTQFITESLEKVAHTFVEALILVILVVFMFLGSWRATLIPILAVPVSLVGTFASFVILGFTINTLTAFAMILAIGLVVDDAIVVVEAVGTPQAVSSAVLLARPGGSIVLMGNPSGDLAMEKNVYWRILRKQLNLMGTWNSSYEKDEACDWTEALDALSKKKIPAQALITHCFPSEKLMDGLELMKNHKEPYCKVMVSWE